MADPVTQPTDDDVEAFVAGVEHPVRRRDARRLLALLREVTGEVPRMWGPSMVGFGTYHYRYASGREGDWPPVAFSPRKAASTLYLGHFEEASDLLERLGPHTVGKGCLYLKNLDTVDLAVLGELVRRSYDRLTAGSPGEPSG